VAWLIFLGCLSAQAGDGALTVATYNVQNYTLADRRSADGFKPDYPKPEAEKAALRRVFAALDADVVALQEIGGEAFLRELRRDLASEGINYAYGEAMLAEDEARGLAVLSRVPLGRVTAHRELATKRRGDVPGEVVRRGLLEVEVPTSHGPVTLFIVHLKSRLTEDREDPGAEDQRVAEAQAVRDRVLARFPEPAKARFLILGDCNDLPGSRTLQALQARGKTEISRWIDAADGRGQRWTHVYTSAALYSRFDHVLASPGFLTGAGEGTEGPVTARGRIVDEPWAVVRAASDHRPLVVTFSWGAALP
jgi:endonuclease/exonuclease/phosphatase family metal-dependent hydrolase